MARSAAPVRTALVSAAASPGNEISTLVYCGRGVPLYLSKPAICAFTNPGHHGTPVQRMRASRFGFTVADEAQKQGHILTAAQVHARFEAVYPSIVAP